MLPIRAIVLPPLILLAGSGVFAEEQNLFGLMLPGGEPYQHCAPGADETVHSFDIYVLNPINLEFESQGERQVNFVNGFECRLEGAPWGSEIQFVGIRFPVPTINVGSTDNIVAGFGEPLPVSAGGVTVLATVDFVVSASGKRTTRAEIPLTKLSPTPCDDGRAWILMSPVETPSLAGLMAYLDAEDTDNPLVAARSAIEWEPAFTVTGAVASESQAWGGVKALYR